jgi:hypothetical protein
MVQTIVEEFRQDPRLLTAVPRAIQDEIIQGLLNAGHGGRDNRHLLMA